MLPSEPSLHELRTPLNHIIGYSELLTEQAVEAGDQDYLPDLRRITAAGRHLLELLEKGMPAPPLVEEEPDELPDFRETDPEQVETAPLLLVVDDVADNRDLLARRLVRLGYNLETAKDGNEALAMLDGKPFDLVLLDVMMPDLDGYQVLERMKADPKLHHIPVIMISALHESESVARCIELGAEDYLPKPFDPTLLRARVSACLKMKAAHDREMRLFEQLEQNYDRLQELEKRRDDLTQMIVHDLRTPLTSVIAGMQTLDQVGDLNPDQQEMMQISVDGAQALLRMINDLLDVEKLESGMLTLELQPLNPDDLIAKAVAQVASLAAGKQLRLIQPPAAAVPAISGDEGMLVRTLVNLMGNAIKFTPEGGALTIESRTSDESRSVAFCVTDTGEGIPADAFARIFEKFGQVESRKAGRKMSTGLGLTFCKLAVESHGGEIGVESTPGEGSTFWFTIPALR